MGLALFILLLILIFGGVGLTSAALHIFFWLAVIMLVIWVVGFFVGPQSGTSGRRWYRW